MQLLLEKMQERKDKISQAEETGKEAESQKALDSYEGRNGQGGTGKP